MLGNFSPGYLKTCFYPAGYFDLYNVDSEALSDKVNLDRLKISRKSLVKSENDSVWFDLLFKPPSGILNSKIPLVPKTEMIISFDRAPSELALINMVENTESSIEGKAIDLKNVFMRASYYSSPYLRNFFDTISSNEITYSYDECQVLQKSLPTGLNIIRLSNLIGGKHYFLGEMELGFHNV